MGDFVKMSDIPFKAILPENIVQVGDCECGRGRVYGKVIDGKKYCLKDEHGIPVRKCQVCLIEEEEKKEEKLRYQAHLANERDKEKRKADYQADKIRVENKNKRSSF